MWKIFEFHKKCDFHASNEEEKRFIEDVFGDKIRIFIAQNFPKFFIPQFSLTKTTGALNLVSIALISPMKNHLLVLKAMAKCNKQICYNIYGPVKDEGYWQRCLQQINQLPPNITVNYYGDIPPNEVEQVLMQNHVFILPSKSENFGHAIFEALSAGRPVIISHQTQWNNLKPAKAGINVTPENIEELSNAIDYFATMDHAEYLKWGCGANEYSSNIINIDGIKHQYQKMFLA